MVRNGRITPAQADALDRLLPRFKLPYSNTPIDLADTFGRNAETFLEIGFGNGDVLLQLASSHPGVNVIGAEVHQSGIGHVLMGIENQALENIRVIQHDAMEVLKYMLADDSLDRVLLLFPDPWHKKRHHKRRIVQQEFLDAVARTLKPGGLLHCATDWEDYANWILERIEPDERFENLSGSALRSPRPEWRPLTRFERRAHRLGHEVTDLLYRRRPC